jgi:hypothetical protein
VRWGDTFKKISGRFYLNKNFCIVGLFLFIFAGQTFKNRLYENSPPPPLKSLSVAAAIIVSLFCLQGCAVDQMPLPDPLQPYLHVEFSESGALSPSQLEMLTVAWQRVDKFVRVESGLIILEASAEELNMSEELFAFLKSSIEGQNRITTRAYALPENELPFEGYDNPNPGAGGGGAVRFTAGFGYYQWTAYFGHDEAIQIFHSMQNIGNNIGLFGTVSGGIGSLLAVLGYIPQTAPYIALESFLFGIYSYLTSAQRSNYETQYLNSGYNNGITIEKTQFTASTVPYTVTTISPTPLLEQ